MSLKDRTALFAQHSSGVLGDHREKFGLSVFQNSRQSNSTCGRYEVSRFIKIVEAHRYEFLGETIKFVNSRQVDSSSVKSERQSRAGR